MNANILIVENEEALTLDAADQLAAAIG